MPDKKSGVSREILATDLEVEVDAEKNKRSKFEESLIVEGVKSSDTKLAKQPTYKKIDKLSSDKIEVFFRGITEEEFYKYRENPQNQGISSGGEPFKCYIEEDGKGNIIVTPTKMIKVKNADKENGEYIESRKMPDDSIATVSLKKVHGDIVSTSFITTTKNDPEKAQKFKKIFDYYSDPNNIQTLEMKDMSENEKIAYIQTLQKLGIETKKFRSPEDMTKDEYQLAKEEFEKTGKGLYQCSSIARFRNTTEESTIGNCVFDDQDKPLSMSFAKHTPEGLTGFQSFRRTAEGKYLDVSSYRIVKGKPTYKLLEYESVVKKMKELGVDTNKFEKMHSKVDELDHSFPREAERITERANKDKEQQKNANGR